MGAAHAKFPFGVISLSAESATAERYDNHSIADVNDHESHI
jgi:hypothetical protein